MEKLDNVLLNALRDKIYAPEYIAAVLEELRCESLKKNSSNEKGVIKTVEAKLYETEQALSRLYEGVEKGAMALDEILKDRLQQHKQARDSFLLEITNLKHQQ